MIIHLPTTLPTVTVIDAIPGTGKTTWMQNHIRETYIDEALGDDADVERTRWLYIAVTEAERDRMKKACGTTPQFHDPYPLHGRKLLSLHEMLLTGQDIVSTHALLTRMNLQTLAALKAHNYHLAIDEELTCVTPYAVKPDDLALLLKEFCDVQSDGTLLWRSDYKQGRFEDIRGLVEAGNLVLVDGKVLVWKFPVSFLSAFQSVTILTYQFEGSLMSSYLRSYRVPYRLMTLSPDRETLVPLLGQRETDLARLRPLIHVVDDPLLNAIGVKDGYSYPFSKTWMRSVAFGKDDTKRKRIQTNCSRYFKEVDGGADAAMWSTYMDLKNYFKGPRYAKSHVAMNLRATNDYRDKSNLAWLVSLFLDPYVKKFLERDGKILADEDGFCLSTLIQWVWRSRIRNQEPGEINLYLPAERPRRLFLDWLEGKRQPAEVIEVEKKKAA
jgi:hypothetical protein